ncbi:MAG: glycosyltransferase [Comamonadaceae bacterium]
MLIHFVHTGDAYLPELQAYVEFVRAAGHQAQLHYQIDTVPSDAAVLWWLCGQVSPELAQRYPAAFHIHEYASASVPPLAWLKDRVKRWHQATPNYRIFQNDWVRRRMGFNDAVPAELRDMGIASDFFDASPAAVEPEFDFVYLGEMRRLRHFLPLFDALAQTGRRVLLIGQMPDDLRPRLQRHTNLSVTGRVPHNQVPAQLRRARYGLNLVPNQLPYTQQTSTKLLEYCAAGLRVLSTDYAWVREFEQQYPARFAYLPCQASVAAYLAHLGPALDQQLLQVPDVRSLAWPRLLAGLQIWHQLGIQA